MYVKSYSKPKVERFLRLGVYSVTLQDQYRLIYEAMREFLNRPGAYVLGGDCRAFPPMSLTAHRAETGASSPVSGTPAIASPGNHGNRQEQVRSPGPWRTPDPLGTPADRAAGSRSRYRPTVAGQSPSAGQYRVVGDEPAGAGTARFWATPWRHSGRDGAELNASMNRATSDDERGTTDVASLDVKPGLRSSSSPAVDVQSSSVVDATPLTAADQLDLGARQTTNDRPTTSSGRRAQSLWDERPTETTAPLTSTPLDHNAPVIT